MRCDLKNNVGKNRIRISENPNPDPNNISPVPRCNPGQVDEPSLSVSVGVSSSSAGASTFSCGKVTRKRRKSTQDATNGSNTDQMNESCLSPSGSQIMSLNVLHDRSQQPRSHGTKQTSDNNPGLPLNMPTSDLARSLHINNKGKAPANRLSASDSHSSFADCLHNHNGQLDFHAINGIDKDNNSLLPITQEIPTLSQASADTATGLQHSGHRSDFHQSQGTSDNNANLALNVATTGVTQSLHINKKRKAPDNVTTRTVQRRLSTNNSQSTSFEHTAGQSDFHQSEGIDKHNNSLLPIIQEIPTLSQASADTATGLQHSGHRSDFHQSQGTSDNNANLALNVATTGVTQSLHINKKRKAPDNVTARTVQRCLSTNNSQSTSFKHSAGQSDFHQSENQSPVYDDLGDCNERCRYCKATFWHGERLKGHPDARYNLCCGGGKFTGSDTNPLDPQVVEGLIQFLDTNNELVQVFRTARDKCAENDVPEFKVRLYNGNGARGYELPTSQAIGAIVFDSDPTTESDYDIIIEYRDGPAKRINKLHQS
ncbi:DNA helicase Pif1-like protein [Artemisia annua]|uniref:DNA helicase Pif1-like protein n=1 Tax=Artemisia annua TaxID=35608 RepID=A0A2U1N9Z2_ARTAN|nr:DNA helicase Pif1-like protein [Artemisia annua]